MSNKSLTLTRKSLTAAFSLIDSHSETEYENLFDLLTTLHHYQCDLEQIKAVDPDYHDQIKSIYDRAIDYLRCSTDLDYTTDWTFDQELEQCKRRLATAIKLIQNVRKELKLSEREVSQY